MNFFKSFYTFVFILFLTIPCWGQSQPSYWIGDGGRGKTVTVSEPTGTGLSVQEQALLPLIQSTIIASFHRFSAMTVFDRQNLENILKEQRLSLSGDFSETDYIRIGNLTNARLVVFGKITKISNNYMLELAVTEVETGLRIASYPPRQVSLLALENLSAIREASADLIGQLGINLTTIGLQEIKKVEGTARVQAENALAKGIAAQRQGTVVEALSYFFQAAAFDPSMREAITRVSVVSANISVGLGQTLRNRIQEHDEWRTIVNTANTFYSNNLPYEFIYDTDINNRNNSRRINYEKRTAEIAMEISLVPTDAWKTINDLRQGLRRARSNDTWNFSLNQFVPRQITVNIQIINENNKVLSTASHAFVNPSEEKRMNATLYFKNVIVDDLTDRLIVQVVSINGIPAQKAGETGFIQITTLLDYDKRISEIQAAKEAAKREWLESKEGKQWQAKENAKIQREEAAMKRQKIFKHTTIFPLVAFELGYIYKPEYPIGFRIGTHGFYTTWNIHITDWQGYSNSTFYTHNSNGEIRYKPDAIDLGQRVEKKFEWVFGSSINIFDNLLMIPIGVGARSYLEYRLYSVTTSSGNITWIPIGSESGYGFEPKWQTQFLFEIGLSFNPIKYISLITTYRLVGFEESNFTIGSCVTFPRQRRK